MLRASAELASGPARGRPREWVAIAAAWLALGLVLRALSVPVLVRKYANAGPATWILVLWGAMLGAMEDVCVGAVLCASLSAYDRLTLRRCGKDARVPHPASWTCAHRCVRFVVYALHALGGLALLCADQIIVRTRGMRFHWDIVRLYLRERKSGAADQLQIEAHEWLVVWQIAGLAVVWVGLMAWQAAGWLHLAGGPSHSHRQAPQDAQDGLQECECECNQDGGLPCWRCPCISITRQGEPSRSFSTGVSVANTDTELEDAGDDQDESKPLEDGRDAPPHPQHRHKHQNANATQLKPERQPQHQHVPLRRHSHISTRAAPHPWTVLGFAVCWIAATVVIAQCVPSVVAMIAWNASLNEPLRMVTGVECYRKRKVIVHKPVSELIDTTTEQCEFMAPDSLARRTFGFQGPTAFDVRVEEEKPPNVLIIVMESFRQRDSRYLLQEDAAKFLPKNLTLTPRFDQWAQRGIAFSRMWSSWRTSRAIEQILFGQLPYDSRTDSGTTTGHEDITLSGLPQFFKAKGYSTIFTTGTRLNYDDWRVFLDSHGFDHIMDGWEMADVASSEMDIDWTAGDHMMAYWGMHDDITFDVLAHMLKQKRENKQDTKPWFATHFTISSHVPFDEKPDWFFRARENPEFPDFSPLYATIEDPEIRELVQNYAELRYFSDLTFGRFMTQIEASGVLNDTIVVVVGDHGHAPERGVAMPEEDQVGSMNVAAALIAEHRLGKHAGTIIRDATAQYDLLDTLADITGVPSEGFIQSGIGRSLKRAAPSGDKHVVYSNNPALNMGIVQGPMRIHYYPDVLDVVRVFNIEHDPYQERDLAATMPKARWHEIMALCDEGRVLNDYFKTRWDRKCLLQAACEN